MTSVKKARAAVAIAGGFALAVATAAGAQGATLVSPTDPYKACGLSSAQAGQAGQLFLDAEVEPQLAVSPDGTNLVATWHQDRWSNGGAHGIFGAFSTDGGDSWSNVLAPGFTDCVIGGLSYQRASDPWQSIGPDGTVYASALSFDGSTGRNAVSAAVSKDQGHTWSVQTIAGSVFPTAQNGTDKNSTTADPKQAGVAYTVWDTLNLPTDQPDDHPHSAAYSGPAYFSKTTDGGSSWSPAKIIIGTANRQQTIGNVIVVDPTSDTLYDFTDLIVPPNPGSLHQVGTAQVAVASSTDGGESWSAPQVIAPFNSVGAIDPNTGAPLRVGDGLQEAAVDPNTGQLYVVWESASDATSNLKSPHRSWDNEILLSTSTDRGRTWSAPTVVHRLASDLPTFTPTVAVNANGVVGVSYYDMRNLGATQTANLPTDYWISFSSDNGQTFPASSEVHLAGPFDSMTAPVARGFFLGDYEGLQASGSSFLALFVKTNCDGTLTSAGVTFPTGGLCAPANYTTRVPQSSNTNPTDVFFEKVTPSESNH